MLPWYNGLVLLHSVHVCVNQQANEKTDADPAYLLSNSKESIAIVALVVGLNSVRVLGGPRLLVTRY
jgi:hypothetical protein